MLTVAVQVAPAADIINIDSIKGQLYGIVAIVGIGLVIFLFWLARKRKFGDGLIVLGMVVIGFMCSGLVALIGTPAGQKLSASWLAALFNIPT